jgi:hypothetical protein
MHESPNNLMCLVEKSIVLADKIRESVGGKFLDQCLRQIRRKALIYRILWYRIVTEADNFIRSIRVKLGSLKIHAGAL